LQEVWSYHHSVTLLVGDPERERTTLTLQRHYREGRLTADELGERLQIALSARHRNQLRRALDDLPRRWADPEATIREALRPAVRIARDAALLAATGVLWLFGSFLLLLAFAAWLLADGPGLAGVLAFPLIWLTMTWLLWAGARRRRTRRR